MYIIYIDLLNYFAQLITINCCLIDLLLLLLEWVALFVKQNKCKQNINTAKT